MPLRPLLSAGNLNKSVIRTFPADKDGHFAPQRHTPAPNRAHSLQSTFSRQQKAARKDGFVCWVDRPGFCSLYEAAHLRKFIRLVRPPVSVHSTPGTKGIEVK